MQLAWARVDRRYQSSPSTWSARKKLAEARPLKILVQRYTPIVADNISTVQAANPSHIHVGIVIAVLPPLQRMPGSRIRRHAKLPFRRSAGTRQRPRVKSTGHDRRQRVFLHLVPGVLVRYKYNFPA